jgi:hypothetical protein
MMRRPLSLALWLLAAGSAAMAQPQAPSFGLRLTGLGAAPIAQAQDGAIRLAAEPSLKWRLPAAELRGRLRLRWLEQDGQARSDHEVRELVAAWRGETLGLTVGAQQLNWGRMDIVRLTDSVNPVDQQDLFHEELPESKRALWMLNLEWQQGPQAVQLVVAPQVPVDRFPERIAGLPATVERPRRSAEDTTVGLRYGFEASGWNADLVAVRGWQPTPVFVPVLQPQGPQLHGVLFRQDSVGFSADRPFGAAVLRLEGLYARTRPTPSTAAFGLPAQRSASLGAGVDLRHGPWFLAVQAIGQRTLDAPPGLQRPTLGFVSLILQRKWLQDRLAARALHIHETDSGSSWSSLMASYELAPNQLVQVQLDRFHGNAPAAFGPFVQRSRLAASLRLDF